MIYMERSELSHLGLILGAAFVEYQSYPEPKLPSRIGVCCTGNHSQKSDDGRRTSPYTLFTVT